MHFHNVVMKHFSEPKHFRSLLIPICFSAYILLFYSKYTARCWQDRQLQQFTFCAVAYAESFRGESKFCHNRVTSQINFMGSVILGCAGACPGEFCKITPKKRIFVHSGAKF